MDVVGESWMGGFVPEHLKPNGDEVGPETAPLDPRAGGPLDDCIGMRGGLS